MTAITSSSETACYYKYIHKLKQIMTLTKGRQAQALINSYDVETQDDLVQVYKLEMKDVTDSVVIKAVQNELGI